VQLILSDLCNHNCSFCAYRLDGYSSNANFADDQGNKNPVRMIPTEKALEIVRDCAALGVQGLQFTGGGEPTVHPDHLLVMREALDLGLACAMVSNGNLLRPGWESVYPRMHWVRISVDAGSVGDYTSIREVKPAAWTKMWANMEALATAGTPNLGASFIVTKENLNGIYTAARLAQDAGATYFRVGAFFSPALANYYSAENLREAEDQIQRATVDCRGGFVFDQFTKRLDYMARRPSDPFCGYQYLNVYIGGDQKVYRCCEMSYNDNGFLGDLKDQSFMKWFRSHETDAAYHCFDATKCPTCPFHTKNELLEFMTREDIRSLHPEFP
jgi:MoaA/NifB/PqqE/SkfB family radical SAM enzyme